MPEDIRDIPNYDPTTISDEDLVYDWAIVVAWYSRIRQGLPLVHDKETVLNLAHLIHKEMINRSMKHHPEKMGAAGKELLKLLEEGKVIDKAGGLLSCRGTPTSYRKTRSLYWSSPARSTSPGALSFS